MSMNCSYEIAARHSKGATQSQSETAVASPPEGADGASPKGGIASPKAASSSSVIQVTAEPAGNGVPELFLYCQQWYFACLCPKGKCDPASNVATFKNKRL